MVTLAQTMESGQASGTTITQANSAVGGNAWDLVTIGAGAAVTYNSTASRGALCMQCTTGGTAAVASTSWTSALGSTLPAVYGRAVVRPGALTAITPIIRARGGAGVQLLRLSINTAGRIELRRNTTNTLVSTSAGAMTTADSWLVRWGFVVGTSAAGFLTIHYNPTVATPDEVFTPTGVDWGTDLVNEANGGIASATSNGSVKLDDFVVTDQGLPGLPAQSISLSESFTAADAVARAAAYTRALAEPVTLTDTVTRQRSSTRTLAESLTMVDAVTRTLALPRALSESLSLADAVTRQLAQARGLTETVALDDTVERMLATARTLTEAVGFVDAVSATADGAPPRIPGTFTLSTSVAQLAVASTGPGLSVATTVAGLEAS